MATDRPRIQGYIDSALHDRFLEWKQERGIAKDSEALNQLLAEYFGVSSQSPIPNPQSLITTEQIEEMIAEECELRMKEIKEHVAAKLPTLTELDSKIDSYIHQRMEEKSEEWMNQLGEKFYERIYTLEQKLQVVERTLDVKDGIPTLFQEALQTVEQQRYVIEELLGKSLDEAPIEGLAEISHAFPKSPSESLEREWKIGDRVRVLCKCNYEKMLGTIVDYVPSLGWGVHVDQWWRVNGISESVIDERQKKGSNIWCDAHEMELLSESPSESLHDRRSALRSSASLSPEQLPQDEAPGLEEGDSQSADVEGDTEEEFTGDSLLPDELPGNSPRLSAAPSLPEFLNAANLARRLRISKSVISRRKSEPNFEEWSKRHDPAGIGWRFPGKGQRFFPVL